MITPLKAPHGGGCISVCYNYTVWRTINGKHVCANPEEDITEMQSSLCVHDGMPLMYKQKTTAFFSNAFLIKIPISPFSVKTCPLLLGLLYVHFSFHYIHIPNGNSCLPPWA